MLTVKCDNSDLYWNKHKTRQVMDAGLDVPQKEWTGV